MNKIAIATLLAAFATVPAVAAAEAYIGLNVGSNQMTAPAGANIGSTTAYSILGGYSFNQYIAAEVAYTDLGTASLTAGSVPVEDMKGTQMSLAAVGSLPLGKDFALLGKLGYASIKIDTTGVGTFTGGASNTKSDLIYGVGAQYNIGKNVGLRLNYDMFNVGDSTTTNASAMVSLGAIYKF